MASESLEVSDHEADSNEAMHPVIQKQDSVGSIETIEMNDSTSPQQEFTSEGTASYYLKRQSMEFEAQRNVFQTLMDDEEKECKIKSDTKKLLQSRVQTMQKTSEEFYSYLKTMVDAETKHEEHLHKLLPSESLGSEDRDKMTVHTAGTALMGLARDRYVAFCKFNDNIFQKVIRDLHEMQQKSKSQKSIFQRRIKSLGVEKDRLRNQLSKSWTEYQESLQNASKAPNKQEVSSPKWRSYKESAVDPCIAGKKYLSIQREYAQKSHEHNEALNEVLTEIVIQDERRIDGMKAVLTDYFNAEKAKTMAYLRLIDTTMDDVQRIDKRRDIDAFIGAAAHGLESLHNDSSVDDDDESSGKKKERQFSMKFNITESQLFDTRSRHLQSGILSHIELQGKLFFYRSGTIKKSSWKPVHGIVTKFGYFHLFEQEGDSEPFKTVMLDDAEKVSDMAARELDLYSFEIKMPKKKRYLCKVVEPDELKLWVDKLEAHIHRESIVQEPIKRLESPPSPQAQDVR